MPPPDIAREIVTDLLRSAWVVEEGRARVYGRWATADSGFSPSAERAHERATIVGDALAAEEVAPDHQLVERHADWIQSLVGAHPEEVGLGAMFLTRLGDWVEAHAGRYLGAGSDRFAQLGAAEKSQLRFPAALPPPPPFEPLEIPEVEPPGRVRFRFGILGDMHIGSAAAEDRVRAAVRGLNDAGVDLVIQLGDITDKGNRDEFDLATKVLSELDMPFATMMGNHDVFSMSEERLSGRDYYGATFGREPDGVVLEHEGYRFAVLDSIEHGASPFGPFDLVSGRFVEGASGAIVRGSLTYPQHDLLADIAGPAGGPAFVFLHHPPQPFTGFPPILFGLRDEDSGRLHAVADSGNVWGVFAGHTHRNARTRTYGTVPVHEVGIPRDYPFGFAVVEVTDTGYAYRFRQLPDEAILRRAYEGASVIHRRYARGSDDALAFTWTVP